MAGANAPFPLRDPLSNRGTAYRDDERVRLGIEGLLPPAVESLEQQAARALENLRAQPTPLARYDYLSALRADNETLFFRLLLDYIEEMLPVVYTPTVGEACLVWSRIYQRPQGLYIAARHRGRIAQLLRNWPRQQVGMIVVTDGGRILGLGDLGANGMGIPVGKLALYTACAGIDPGLCLPIVLDVGTDNVALRNDALYLGERLPRLSGEPYDALLEEFISAAQAVFPGAIVQFEDFNGPCAFRLLQRYRGKVCCFNDDIQGTGAMGLAGLMSAGRITGKPLVEQRLLFVGAGEACLGIGALVIAALQREGLSESEAKQRCWFVDSKGVVVASREDLAEHKRPYAQERAPLADLLAVVEAFKPTALIGACAQAGRFTQPLLAAMARINARPIVFALSNPTSKAECTAEQAYAWTEGRAIFASGSLCDPITFDGCVHAPGQANNAHVFPGVGLGLMVAGATQATDDMFYAAAHALAAQVTEADLKLGRVFPAAARMREVAATVALAVAEVAYRQGHATKPQLLDLQQAIARAMYQPHYP